MPNRHPKLDVPVRACRHGPHPIIALRVDIGLGVHQSPARMRKEGAAWAPVHMQACSRGAAGHTCARDGLRVHIRACLCVCLHAWTFVNQIGCISSASFISSTHLTVSVWSFCAAIITAVHCSGHMQGGVRRGGHGCVQAVGPRMGGAGRGAGRGFAWGRHVQRVSYRVCFVAYMHI